MDSILTLLVFDVYSRYKYVAFSLLNTYILNFGITWIYVEKNYLRSKMISIYVLALVVLQLGASQSAPAKAGKINFKLNMYNNA